VPKRQQTRLQVGKLEVELFNRLRNLFSDLRAARQRTSTKAKTLRFSSGLMVSVVVCLSLRTSLRESALEIHGYFGTATWASHVVMFL
jgi:hypothetical protein